MSNDYTQAFFNALALAGPEVVRRLAADVGLCEEVVRAALQTMSDLERELAGAQQTIQCLRDQNSRLLWPAADGEE